MANPLRYEITDWHQLSAAKSNNSRDLSIKVSDLINSKVLTGIRIRIEHSTYGTLFTYVVNAAGAIITEPSSGTVFTLSNDEILAELAKYGFFITFDEKLHLPPAQINFLQELLSLGYDKLRILNVYENRSLIREAKTYIVVFNIKENPNWLDNDYAATTKEFTEALLNGSAVNISASDQSHKWSWSWLDFVANIQDILDDNE